MALTEDAAPTASLNIVAETAPAPTEPTTSHRGPRIGGMVPAAERLPKVLPTDRLTENGRPKPPIRDDLRKIHNVRNALNVSSVWAQSFGVIALAIIVDHPLAWVAAFFLMGRSFALYAILAHEAAHRLLFTKKKANDWVGGWCLGYVAFVPVDAYRRGHMAHHRDEMGPEEPDVLLYANYPIPRDSMKRKLMRDAFGSSGWKNLKGLLNAMRSPTGRAIAGRIVIMQVVLMVGFALIGRWYLYFLLWLLPWMTVWRVINRLRSIAEHGGMGRSKDRRETTHHVHQSLIARFWMVPFNTGWHLAHHVDIGVPFQNLPAMHHELVDAGWMTSDLEYPNYRALWKALSAG